ncbi:MAG TPA: FG-GAP-like repeat-containing protein [Caulobacter sp.]|nr:FG-GAP-like repeat-containing protein [Caulobacter sp.]
MPFASSITLSALDGALGFRIDGALTGDRLGRAVASAGDVNGDGIEDLVVGAYWADDAGSYSGAAYVVFGTRDGFPASLDIATLDGTNGFRLLAEAAGDRLGQAVSGLGDINGDGYGDILVGAPSSDAASSNSGAAWVVFGKASGFTASVDLASLDGSDGFQLTSAVGGRIGQALGRAGDVNGDGIDDILIGAPFAAADGPSSGAAYLVFGTAAGFPADFDLADLDGTNGFRIEGENLLDLLGMGVAGAGDINGDGFDDLVVGAPGAYASGLQTGVAYVVFGKASGFAASLDPAALTAADGFRIVGEGPGDKAGYTVSAAGDVNGDGFADLLIAAHYNNTFRNDNGAAYVVFGKASGFGTSFNLSGLNGANGFKLAGATDFELLGLNVSAAGDFNGDGYDDVLIGSPQSGAGGAAYIVFGKASGFSALMTGTSLFGSNGFTLNSGENGARAGWGLAAADLNGDGLSDLIVGAELANTDASDTGAAFVVYGRMMHTVTTIHATVSGGALGDEITGWIGKDILHGMAGNDILVGGGSHDVLDGGAGSDAMNGGQGDDTFFVDNAGDTTVEAAGQGADRVRAGISFTLAANFEYLTLEGADDLDGTGNTLSNRLDGNLGANTLDGAGGNDLIKGGGGDDSLIGGTGADQLLGDQGADELDGGDESDRLEGGDGADTLLGGTGADLLDGGADDDDLAGGAGADQLLGGSGLDILDGGTENDVLNGGLGADAMTGGTGDDVFFVDDIGDTTIEAPGQGTDTVRASLDWTLAAHIERLILEGSADLDGTGNDLANVLTGNGGANLLDGSGGNDMISGGLGADILIGGTGGDILAGGGGADSFVVLQESVFSSANPLGRTIETDTVSDYAIGQDIIDLSAIDAVTGGADNAFILVGAFSSQAGQMVLKFAAGTTTLELDIDGDSSADYRLKINGDVTGDTGGWIL